MRARSLLLWLVVVSLIAPATILAAPFTPPAYTIQELPGIPSALSNTGWVAGTITTAQGVHGYRWRAGKIELLPELKHKESRGIGVNDNGDVSGVVFYANMDPWPVEGPLGSYSSTAAVFRDGKVLTFQPRSQYDEGWANAINNAEQVVGGSYYGNHGGIEPVFWTNDLKPFLGLPNTTAGEAFGINEKGRAVGFLRDSYDWNGSPQAVVWELGSVRTLKANTAGASIAYAINDSGLAVGTLVLGLGLGFGTPIYYPVSWDATGDTPAVPLAGSVQGQAFAVNSAGLAVGTSTSGWAMLYAGGQGFRLQPLVTGAAGWILASAKDINDSGQILGVGTRSGQVRGFLLAPVAGRYQPVSGGR